MLTANPEINRKSCLPAGRRKLEMLSCFKGMVLFICSFLLLAQKKRTKEKGSLGFSTTHLQLDS